MKIKNVWRAMFGSKPKVRKEAATLSSAPIYINEHLLLVTEKMFVGNFPDDVRSMAKKHQGRLPTVSEIEQVYALQEVLNAKLRAAGLSQLKKTRYLYTCGSAESDYDNNYCLDFSNGEWLCVDYDTPVCAFLVRDV